MIRLGPFLRLVDTAVRPFLIPVLWGVIVAGAAISLYQVVTEEEERHIVHVVEGEASRAGAEFSEQLARRVEALRGMAERWERSGRSEDRWRLETNTLLGRNLQFRSVAVLDTTLEIVRLAPSTARLPGLDLDPDDDEVRRSSLRALLGRDEPGLSEAVVLHDGRRQVLVDVPLLAHDRRVGSLVGVIRVRDLLDELARPSIQRGYSLAVFEGSYLLFGPVWQESGDEAIWERDAVVQTQGILWMVQVWPGPERLRAIDHDVSKWVLAFGLVLALVVIVVVERLRHWRARAQAVERGSLQLPAERAEPPSPEDVPVPAGPSEPAGGIAAAETIEPVPSPEA